MSVKRGSAEDVYAVALQRLNVMAKAELPEPQSPGAELHARRYHICDRRPWELRVILSLVVRPPHGPMPNEGIQGDEWGAYGVLGRSSARNMGWPTGRESQGHGVPILPKQLSVMESHRRTVMCAVASLTTERVTEYVGEEGKGNR